MCRKVLKTSCKSLPKKNSKISISHFNKKKKIRTKYLTSNKLTGKTKTKTKQNKKGCKQDAKNQLKHPKKKKEQCTLSQKSSFDPVAS